PAYCTAALSFKATRYFPAIAEEDPAPRMAGSGAAADGDAGTRTLRDRAATDITAPRTQRRNLNTIRLPFVGARQRCATGTSGTAVHPGTPAADHRDSRAT